LKEFLIHMKHNLISIASLASCLVMSAAAQSPAVSSATSPVVPAGSPKIAVVAFQEAVAQTNDFQRKFADLQKKYDPKRQEIKTLNDEIASLQKDLQTQATTLNDAERAKRAKILDDKQKLLKRNAQDAQTDFQNDMQQTFADVAPKVADVMNAFAQQHGFSIVLDGGNQQTPVVLYASPSSDITKAVVDAYNVKSGVPAPPPQPAGAAPAPKGAAVTPKKTTPAAH
jgi:outer membrane protein